MMGERKEGGRKESLKMTILINGVDFNLKRSDWLHGEDWFNSCWTFYTFWFCIYLSIKWLLTVPHKQATALATVTLLRLCFPVSIFHFLFLYLAIAIPFKYRLLGEPWCKFTRGKQTLEILSQVSPEGLHPWWFHHGPYGDLLALQIRTPEVN